MKRVLAVVFLIIILLAVWFLFFKTEKTRTATTEKHTSAVSKHSSEFNQKIAAMMNSYIEMKNAFVDADSIEVKTKTSQFISSVDSLNLSELHETDSSLFVAAEQNISDIKANAAPILKENDITEMRHDFSMVSENLYPLLKTIGYEGQKLYWQNCPMAFGDDKPANWLSNTSEILNPYMGKKNPEYKSAMLHCGENMDSLYLK
jgi:Ca2+/Na+ antiporter